MPYLSLNTPIPKYWVYNILKATDKIQDFVSKIHKNPLKKRLIE
jgi:hypothetical protein